MIKLWCWRTHILVAVIESLFFQKYAVEALVQSASKKDKCSGVIKQATPILKQLYQSANDAVKVRALVVGSNQTFSCLLT